MKAMIFAAGLGTRLRPLTLSIPKALVEVDGKPLLEIVTRRIVDAGIDEIVVNAHHFAEQIVESVQKNEGFGARMTVSLETEELLETGGGILHARKLLEGDGAFLVHNVDILSNLDIKRFTRTLSGEALAVLLVSDRPSSRKLLFDDSMRLIGWTNLQTGEVKSPFPGLKVENCRQYAFAGIHMMSDKVFDVMESLMDGPRFPIMDFYLKAAAEHLITGFIQKDLKILDVGKVETLAEAKEFLTLQD